jgi:hypothetical protein
MEKYELARAARRDASAVRDYRLIAEVITEIATFIRFVVVELGLEVPSAGSRAVEALRSSEIIKLVNGYIGVDSGYLVGFSYRSHREFYLELDLDIDPEKYTGTTRERFIRILGEATPDTQATILQGILDRYPIGSTDYRTQEKADEVRRWIGRLRGSAVHAPELRITSETVLRALADAEHLVRRSGAISAVDRTHTALHGYMRAVCERAAIPVSQDPSITELFRLIREHHPAFADLGRWEPEIVKVVRAQGAAVDALNTLRNRASVAHANEILLDEPEAVLAINAARTLLHYLDERIHRYGKGVLDE